MALDERTVGSVTVLTPRGRLTVETFGQLKAHVTHLAQTARLRVVLNMSNVIYVDSIGIAELVRAHVILNRHGGRLALTHLHRSVDELLQLTHLSDIFDIFPTEAEAIQSYAPAVRGKSEGSGSPGVGV